MTAYPLVQDTAHVPEALALLTGQFANDVQTPNVRNLVRIGARRTQDVENVLWDEINSQLLAKSPTGQALNQLGDLIGEPRGTFNDAQYLLWIQIAIRARRNAGRSEDAIQVAALAIGNPTYLDYPPAAYNVQGLNIEIDYIEPLGDALSLAKPPGVRGVFEWSYWGHGQDIVLDDSVAHAVGAHGFADSISGQFPFKVIGATQL